MALSNSLEASGLVQFRRTDKTWKQHTISKLIWEEKRKNLLFDISTKVLNTSVPALNFYLPFSFLFLQVLASANARNQLRITITPNYFTEQTLGQSIFQTCQQKFFTFSLEHTRLIRKQLQSWQWWANCISFLFFNSFSSSLTEKVWKIPKATSNTPLVTLFCQT